MPAKSRTRYVANTAQPCHRTGRPQPQPYRLAGNQKVDCSVIFVIFVIFVALACATTMALSDTVDTTRTDAPKTKDRISSCRAKRERDQPELAPNGRTELSQ